MQKRKLTGLLTVAMVLLVAGILIFTKSERVDFSTEVKPILNKNCISCHGGVKKNGGFSVLFEEEALALTKSGVAAIIPGNPKNSELIKRLHEEDPELRMPYHRASLTDEEIQTLHKWIKQGAKWGKHWAYNPVQKPSINWISQQAGFSDTKKKYQGIDFFVHEKQKENKLTFSEEEDSRKLLRRVSLDITGLPPTEGLQHDWLAGKITYEQLVDRLLDSSSFGEKWASWWLDLARYADTKGYERDVSRTMWKYRDWVIKAFNDDKPFDKFTIEQLAGDLLPNPTQDQMIATAFHRNTMNNDEGGTEDEEFRVAAVLDRVNTTFEVWQSTTMACVQCHSHPYDPFRHEEYFQVSAFFNNTRDEDTHDEEPKLRFYEEEDREKISSILNWASSNGNQKQAEALTDFFNFREPKYHAHLCEDFVNGELIDTKWLGLWHDGSCYLRNVDTQGADQLLMHYNSGLDGTKMTIRKGGPEGEILSQFVIDKTSNVTESFPFQKVTVPIDLYIKAENPKASPQRSTSAITWFAFVNSLPGKEKEGYKEMNDRFYSVLNSMVPTLPIMIENPSFMQRKTHVFERGNWLLHGEEVKPKTPEALNAWNPDWPNNRLGLAYWLTDKENPLTSRTLVNRIWDQLFGRGLISSIEDMGTQSEAPSHPELLDYLSYHFMHEMDWSMKKLIKTIVLSKTYRQKSNLSPELYQQDPQNKWYARGPRIRLSSEQIRDQALYVSGLLSKEMFGPPVMPFQPEGIWETVYSGESWKLSEGEDKHRRAVYTFLKRTSPYPSFITFDAGSREVCVSKRIVTNTPLQALVTLNDPVFMEAAFHLGQRMRKYSDDDPIKAIAFGYELCTVSPISQSKIEIFHSLYKEALSEYQKKPELMTELMPDEANEKSAELAAFTIVANALLNLDEFLTKP